MRVRTIGKREEIVELALAVFMELGFEATTMAEVAARLGGSKTTLYGYFPSKENLFIGVLQHVLTQRAVPILDDLAQNSEAAPRAVLIELGMGLNEMITRGDVDALARIALSQLGKPEFAQQFWEAGPARMVSAISAYLRGQAKAGTLNIRNPEIATDHLMALYGAEIGPPFRPRHTVACTRRRLRQVVIRAVDVFLAAYGVPD